MTEMGNAECMQYAVFRVNLIIHHLLILMEDYEFLKTLKNSSN